MNTRRFFPRSLQSSFAPLLVLPALILPGMTVPTLLRAQDCLEVTGHELTCEQVFNAPGPVYTFRPIIKSHSDYGQSLLITVFNAQNKIVGTFYSGYSSIPRNFEVTPALFIGGAFPDEQLTAHVRLFDGQSRSTSTDSCESIYTFTLPDCPGTAAYDCVEPSGVEAECVESSSESVGVTLQVRNLTPYPLGGVYVTLWDPVWGPVNPQIRSLYDLPSGQTSGKLPTVEVSNTNYTGYPVPFVILAVKGFGDSIIESNGPEWEASSKCIVKLWADIPDCRPSSVADDRSDKTATVLGRSIPNPTTGQVAIDLQLTAPQRVSLVVRDVNGREVLRLLENELLTSGTHVVSGDVSSLPSGTYFYTLESVEGNQTRTVNIVR